jgi:restriction system protein
MLDYIINSRGMSKYIPFKKNEKRELFIQYYNQVALLVINLLFQSDTENFFEEICYNGWIKTKSKTNGKDIEACVVSLSISREKFINLSLEYVDPVECVKSLHGRVEQDLESNDVEGIKPFLKFDFDKKIIQTDSIIDDVKSNNLMDLTWEEFEIYVRDWLKKEFVNAKVEVTQSSRDGGIDAIIYDDDFLKGGVTVVQVKQYNITVPVSAVRDLYGVMQDRRASKGILVTTSDFGYDSRQFVKDKPISLVNGTNLLYYLNKHGYSVEIKKKKT